MTDINSPEHAGTPTGDYDTESAPTPAQAAALARLEAAVQRQAAAWDKQRDRIRAEVMAEAADVVNDERIVNPLGETEEHVNAVIDGIVARLRRIAAEAVNGR